MKRSLIAASLLLVVVASVALAQQRRGPGTGAPALGTPQEFTGTVTSFAASAGTMFPTLVVTDGVTTKSFALGPYWFLSEAKFAAAAGDRVTVVSLVCPECAAGDPVVSVTNLTNGTKVVLRDASGTPLWQDAAGSGAGKGRAAGRGRGGMASGTRCGLLPDITRKATFEGTIVSFAGGPGAGQPELTLATAEGNKVLVPSPYRVVTDAGYTFVPGAKLAVTAAPVTVDGAEEWVVITMMDAATGLELTFRDSTGAPLAGGNGQHRP